MSTHYKYSVAITDQGKTGNTHNINCLLIYCTPRKQYIDITLDQKLVRLSPTSGKTVRLAGRQSEIISDSSDSARSPDCGR